MYIHNRQNNIPMLVECLDNSLSGTPMFGLRWNPAHVVSALATAALFEPSRKRMVKLGAMKMLVGAIEGVGVCVSLSVRLSVCLRGVVVTHTCMHTFMHTHIHTHIYIYIHIHTHNTHTRRTRRSRCLSSL